MEKVTYSAVLRTPGVLPLYLAAFLARIPMMALPLVLTLLVVEGLGGTYGQAGLVAAAETVGAAIGSPWRGRLIDKAGLRRALMPSLVTLAVAYPIVTLVSFWWLLPLAFIAGLFIAPVHSVVRVSLAATLPQRMHRSAFALDSVVAEASFIIGPAAAGALVVVASPDIALLTVAATVAIGLGILWKLNPPTRSTAAEPHQRQPARTWVTRDLLFLFLVSAGSMIALMATDLGIIAALRELDAIELVGLGVFLAGRRPGLRHATSFNQTVAPPIGDGRADDPYRHRPCPVGAGARDDPGRTAVRPDHDRLHRMDRQTD